MRITPAFLFLMLSTVVSFADAAVESKRPFHVYDPELSVARNWNEVLLSSISRDFARPTVHARNLYHAGIAIYDSWAFYDGTADTYLLRKASEVATECPVSPSHEVLIKANAAADPDRARTVTMSYAMYRFIYNRFRLLNENGELVQQAPGFAEIYVGLNAMMSALELDPNYEDVDLSSGSAAALGNYLADCLFQYGRADLANEMKAYANTGYQPVNPHFNPAEPGNPGVVDPDRWQPLQLAINVDQAGNQTSTPPFLGANWGAVNSFALGASDVVNNERDGVTYPVYLDPGPPPSLSDSPDSYKWNHLKVAIWSSHLDIEDGIDIDISPASVGNTSFLPQTLEDYQAFYADDGKVSEAGRSVNPKTGAPYEPQIVPRGDFTRVLAEFWADGPSSLTPPGHWFRVLNQAVLDNPNFEAKYAGVGPDLSRFEWESKAYFVLGAAMHDAAITAWGIKGWYDSARPISAIRYMASKGQSSDPNLPNYHQDGVLLKPGYIELVEEGDELAGQQNENVGKIKLYAWRGPEYIEFDSDDPLTQQAVGHAGVGWILAENWWPYQRPTFVTPPFAGYISGHSTYSRAAAEILTAITGDEYFPGGLGEFVAKKNEFLVFEEGPSVDVKLQWATYRDASDQCSLSRIWGGIHPPADDIPGRRIGIQIAEKTFAKANRYFNGETKVVQHYSYRKKKGGAQHGEFLLMLLLLAGLSGLSRMHRKPKFRRFCGLTA